MDNQTYLTIAEVTQLLRCSRSAVYKWTSEGKLREYRMGRKPLFKRDEVMAAVEAAAEPIAEN